jgi:hypothetical protein
LAHIYFTCDGVTDEVVYLFGFMVFEVGDRAKRSAIMRSPKLPCALRCDGTECPPRAIASKNKLQLFSGK